MPAKTKTAPDAAELDAADAAEKRGRRAQKTAGLDPAAIVQAREPFVSGERIIRPRETFRAGHPIVQKHPSMFDPFVVDNEYEER